MLNESIESRHQRGSISNSLVRTSYDEVNFTVHYYESELQSIARESSPLNMMLRELEEYSSVLRQGGSVALHRGEALMSAQLSE
jgi:prefoldin subunit 5